MSRLLTVAFCMTLTAPGSLAAQTPPAPEDAPAFEVVRAGDNQMECAALISEINALNAEMRRVETGLYDMNAGISAESINSARASMATSSAMSLGQLAASMIPGAGLAMGAAQMLAGAGREAQQQAQRERTFAQMEAATAQTIAAANSLTPLNQRVEHLGAISRAKTC